MPVWLLACVFAAMRAVYSATVEALITWTLTNWILPHLLGTVDNISYWMFYIFWFIIGFIIAFKQFYKIAK